MGHVGDREAGVERVTTSSNTSAAAWMMSQGVVGCWRRGDMYGGFFAVWRVARVNAWRARFGAIGCEFVGSVNRKG